ncbi:hypothetical protein D9756_006516 [Leucocoprinus leucothites]|uniref:Polyketide synthase n=1 Tax=Leucocoprinus leucothites TaxID=201217 RepID=A0A8H5LGZ2_9AGAR|nr:hypothetical protein D9756_006516 [Leucoagaricus leucothites]
MFAIVGVAAQLPAGLHSATDLGYDEFWDFLLNGGEAVENLSELTLEPNPFKSVDLSSLPEKGCFLKNVDRFDYSSFGLSSADAKVMPNSARRLMELSFYALQDAGVQTRGQAIGCFMSGNNDLDVDAMDTDGSLAYIPSAIPNRISYAFNLTGPSVAVDTACSSSLTSLHLAISAIKNGDCAVALVGAAQSNRKVTEWWRYDKARVLSSDGVCKPFDDRADGFSRGEGAIVVVVKSLQDALRDKDHIYCTVAGSFHATTGSELPVYVPNGTTQRTCISQAYARAGREPTEADYVELHITGTSVGDPIEANAAGEIFCKNESRIKVGSVKGNIGHLECAAFLASLVKVCHIFEKGIIPPTPNFALPNSSINWTQFDLDIVTKPVPLGCKEKGRSPLISIASAGIGGSTGHVLLEAPPSKIHDASVAPLAGTPVLFLVGGLTPNAVHIIAQQLDQLPEDYTSVLENAVFASRQARQLPWRSFVIYRNRSSLSPEIPRPVLAPPKIPHLAFVFSGQGPHNAQMGHQLFQQYPVFRNTVLELDAVHQNVMGYSFLDATGLFSREMKDTRVLQRKWPVILTLPALVMIHIGLFELLGSMGIVPNCLLGHSAGETAILYASGAGSKAMAMEIALARGRSMTCTESMDAAMAVVGCAPEHCRALIDRVHLDHSVDPDVEVSCFNAPDSVVVSGKRTLVEAVISLAKEQGVFAQGIHTLVPGHCRYIEYCREEHWKLMEDIFARYPGPHIPTVPVYSTCRPNQMVEEFTPEYFWNNARNPVYFSNATSRILADNVPGTVFLEISPHPVLSSTVAAHGVPTGRIICPMQRLPRDKYDPQHETTCLLSSVAELVLAGYDRIDLSGFYGATKSRKPVFKHPLQQLQVPSFKTYAVNVSTAVNPLLSSLPLLNPALVNLFSQHRVADTPVVPGTGWLELVLEAGGRYLWDVEFQSLFSLHQDRQSSLYFEREGRNKWSITASQQANGQAAPSRVVIASGCFGMNSSNSVDREKLDISGIQEKLSSLPLEVLHGAFGGHFYYGPSFDRLLKVYGNPSEVLAELRGLDDEERSMGFVLHPAILDACLRAVAFKELLQDWESSQWFPKHIGKFIHYGAANDSTSWFTYARLKSWAPDSRTYDMLVTDSRGHPICEWKNLKFQKVSVSETSNSRDAVTLTTEPLRIPTAAPFKSEFFHNQDEDAYMKLYHALDYLAIKQFRQTLQRRPTCGDTIDRIRYLKRMEDLIEDQNRSEILNEQVLREQKLRFPAFFEVTKRLGEVHESLLQSSQAAVNVLFTDDLMSQYYAEHNQLTKACEEMAQRLDKILQFLRDSGKHIVRILEIGAGTGTLTQHLIPIVTSHRQLIIEYTVTDVSYSLVADLARSQDYERLIPQAYDATKDPFSQGYSPESFDIIVAYHVLHVAPELQSLSRQLHELLVPGGLLLVTEIDNTSWSNKPGAPWMDFAFGSFAEWFNYQDTRDHCSMSPSQWHSLVQSSGFDNFTSIIGSGHCLDFIFTCQKATSGEIAVDRPPVFTLVHFMAGQELKLQQRLAAFKPATEGVLCLWTDSKHDGDTALGLVVTLSKEFPAWTIWLAMFSSCIDPARAESIIRQNHRHLSQERHVYFSEDGSPSFPRVVRLSPVSTEVADFDASTLPENHLLVRVVDRDSEGGFVGEVLQSDDPAVSAHSFVAGLSRVVTSGFMTQNALSVHAGSVICIPELDKRVLPYLAGILLLYHTVGSSRFMYSNYHHPPLHILISICNEELSKALTSLLNRLTGVSVLTEAPDDFVDVLVTDHHSLNTNPVLEQSVGTNGRVLIWSPQLLEETPSKEPWMLRHILEVGLRNLDIKPVNGHLPPRIHSSPQVTDEVAQEPLVSPHKAYILIGGIGGIGLHLAVWLYKNGARHIYLTSRRGRETVNQAHDIFLRLKLQYLESQSDLHLKLVACDALNAIEVSVFLKTVKQPVGGCFLMPLVLRDALFLQQSHETIEAVRQSKVGALDVLSSLCDIKSMDFLVGFSSVTALWGNVGQSNYSSSCAALGGRMSEYPNAFAILVPAILDAGYLMQAGVLDHLNIPGSLDWGISVKDLCEFLMDGICRVKAGNNPSIIIPTLDLSIVSQHIPLPPLYRFVVPRSSPKATKTRIEISQMDSSDDELLATLKSAQAVVMAGLGVEDQGTFSRDLPFINHGLDSIRASQLSRALRPYVKVTQTDLLVGMAWNDLEERIKEVHHSNATQAPDAVVKSRELVMTALGIDSPSNFSPDVPFVNSGLDSIRATQLSRQLRPYARVTHMDLLLGMCWRDLESKIIPLNDRSSSPRPGIAVNRPRQVGTSNGGAIEDAHNLVIGSLGIELTNFDADIPFINYGLDSIRATQLSRKLRPFVQVTQMDLLLGMTWKDLNGRIRNKITAETGHSVVVPVQEKPRAWSVLFTKLKEASPEKPVVFALPGITGNLSTISPLMNHSSKDSATLWAAHFDLSACEENPPTMEQLADEVLRGINQRHPSGPLRVISISGSSTLACVLTKALEDQGRNVTDVTFLDHFPALFCHDAYGLRPFMASQEETPEILKAKDDVAEKGVEIMLRMQEIDSTIPKQPSNQDDAMRLQGIKYLETARVVNSLVIQAIKDVHYKRRTHPSEAYDTTLLGWLASIKAPILLAVADRGFNLVVEMPWADMGAGRLIPLKKNVEVLHLDEGHFSIVGCELLAKRLSL